MTRKAPSEFISLIKTRKAIPVATAAVAAVSLAGCGMLPTQNAVMTPPPSPEQQVATAKVQSFTTDIDQALDKVDRERLRLAAQQQAKPAAAAVPPSAAVTPATPSTTPPTDTAQASVILASSAAGPAVATPVASSKTPAPQTGNSASPVSTTVKSTALADAAPKVAPAAKEPAPPPVVAGTILASAAPTVAENGTAVITPMAPVTATSASAMSSMTAMLTMPAAPVQVAMVTPAQAPPAEPTMDEALAVVRKNIADHPTLTTALALALLDNGAKSANTPDPAQSLSDMDKKILGDLLSAFGTMKTQSPDAAPTLADRAAPLIAAEKLWQADADLVLPKMVLASRVDSFGVYNAIDAKFEQGKRHTVIIYCEVANFSAKKGDDGWFTTDLEQQETLITDDGLLIWRPNAEEIQDRSMNQRRDFYLVKKLTIPENLAAGKYTLRMNVVDKNANKRQMVSMPIEIAGN